MYGEHLCFVALARIQKTAQRSAESSAAQQQRAGAARAVFALPWELLFCRVCVRDPCQALFSLNDIQVNLRRLLRID
jgi:ribonuclease I